MNSWMTPSDMKLGTQNSRQVERCSYDTKKHKETEKMKIRALKESDAERLDQFLTQRTETSMFIRSNLRRTGILFQDSPYYGDYWGAFNDKSEFTGVLAHYWNGNIMSQTDTLQILDSLLDVFKTNTVREVKGLVGAQTEVDQLIHNLALKEQNFSLNSKEGLFSVQLDQLIEPDYRGLELIDAKKLDEGLLFDWLKAYDIEALGSEDNAKTDKDVTERVERTLSEPDMWALYYQGTPVSLSGFNARLPDIVQIGPVWTPVQHRNRGYARSIVALTLEQARREGVEKAILFTDSPSAIRAYESVGFSRIGDFGITLLKEPLRFNRA